VRLYIDFPNENESSVIIPLFVRKASPLREEYTCPSDVRRR
jgi:hypothetical protein